MYDEYQPRSLDELHRSLKSILGELEGDLGTILDGAEGSDPAAILNRLDERMGELDGALRDLRTALETAPSSGGNFNLMLEKALDEVLVLLEIPLVIRAAWEGDLPAVGESNSEPISAAMRRILSLAARHAGPGGELKLKTNCHDGQVLLHVDVVCHDTDHMSRPQEPMYLRCRSVEEFVRDLGGRFHLTDGPDHSMHLVVQFDVGVETT